MNISSIWEDGKITIQEVRYDESSNQFNQHVVQGMTATCEEWLDIAVTALMFMPGKPNDDKSGYALGPYGVDPDMIGALVAAKLREKQSFQ